MIELLILYEINKTTLTMYGISKQIGEDFSTLLATSFGTIKPALRRLEKNGCIKSQKIMSEGGRPSVYYSITKDGIENLKELLLEEPSENCIQFLTYSRIKLATCAILNDIEQNNLYKLLKLKAQIILADIKKKQEDKRLDFYQKMVFDNLSCEYNNFLTLIAGFEHVG